MSREMINVGHTNKTKYREGNTFVLIKEKNGFNHGIDYSVLSEFDFVPKLIEETEEKLVWEFIEGDMLSNPTDDDLRQVGKILRALHKSDVEFPRNNLRKRIQAYVKRAHELGRKWPEIEDNWREMITLMNRMGSLNPCHNDVWDQNLIKDKNGKIWLVDWEYATMGDKHYDLAFFIKSMRLNDKQRQIFLDEYNSYDDYSAYIEEWMPKYERYVAWITLCWAAAQDKLPFDVEWIKAILRETKK